MKPSMLFAVVMLAAIVIATSFGLSFGTSETLKVPANLAGQVLYVCPAADQPWTSIAGSISGLMNYFLIGLGFAIIILAFSWGWALYQNLLKDEFKQDLFKKSWAFTKTLFWTSVIIAMLAFTPNYFRSFTIQGAQGQWVLCDNNTPGAKAVIADAIKE